MLSMHEATAGKTQMSQKDKVYVSGEGSIKKLCLNPKGVVWGKASV